MNKEHTKQPTFGKRSTLPVGTGAPVGTRCFQLLIPDSDEAIRQLLGVLRLLTFWQSFERDAAHKAKDWADAWLAAIRASVGQEECVIQTRLRQGDTCTLEWSYDDWATLDSLDLSVCVQGWIDSLVPGMITQGIQDAINNGTIGQPSGANSPTSAAGAGVCKHYHVTLAGSASWVCPVPVSTGDTVQISGWKGGWCDGTLAWYCGDGARYLATICDTSLHSHQAGDPSASAWHMAVVGKMGATVFDPIAGWVVPGGTINQLFTLQANDGTMTDNSGAIEFDVSVCGAGAILLTYLSGTGPTIVYPDTLFSPYTLRHDGPPTNGYEWSFTGNKCFDVVVVEATGFVAQPNGAAGGKKACGGGWSGTWTMHPLPYTISNQSGFDIYNMNPAIAIAIKLVNIH